VTETNPTMTEFAELVAEEKAALLAVIDVEDDTPKAARARARLHEARAAILAARPSDRKVMGSSGGSKSGRTAASIPTTKACWSISRNSSGP
jgi:hypothetical protein